MTTTIPDAATIAGLRAQVDALETSLRTTSEGFSDAEADRLLLAVTIARLTAERDHLAGMVAGDRDAKDAEQAIKAAADLRDHLDAVAMALGVGCSASASDVTEDAVDAVAALKDDRDALQRQASSLLVERNANARAVSDGAMELNAAKREILDLKRQVADVNAARAALTAKVAALEARPVLTVERLAEVLDTSGPLASDAKESRATACHRIASASVRHLLKLGPVTLPTPDRAEELASLIAAESASIDETPDDRRAALRELTPVVRRALASLAPQPAERAPEIKAKTLAEAINRACAFDAPEMRGDIEHFTQRVGKALADLRAKGGA